MARAVNVTQATSAQPVVVPTGFYPAYEALAARLGAAITTGSAATASFAAAGACARRATGTTGTALVRAAARTTSAALVRAAAAGFFLLFDLPCPSCFQRWPRLFGQNFGVVKC